MKFAKRLESEAYEEWVDHYIPYKALKKVLKKAYPPKTSANDAGSDEEDIEPDVDPGQQTETADTDTGTDQVVLEENSSPGTTATTPYTTNTPHSRKNNTEPGGTPATTKVDEGTADGQQVSGDGEDVIPSLTPEQSRKNREVSQEFLDKLREVSAQSS